jgi:hypothetical protein
MEDQVNMSQEVAQDFMGSKGDPKVFAVAERMHRQCAQKRNREFRVKNR